MDEKEYSSLYLMNQNRVRIGVIPAAGSGSRLGYLSAILPKALFPLYDRPILHYVINQMQSLGITDIYIVVHVYKEKIIEYCKSIAGTLRVRLHFVEQPTLSGTADAILQAERHIRNRPFLVMYGDDCTISDSLPAMMNFFQLNDGIVTEAVIGETRDAILRQTCSVRVTRTGKMVEIMEKPSHPPYHVRGCGVYMFRPEIFTHIRATPVHSQRKEREITHTINMLAQMGLAYGYRIRGHNININNYDELIRASMLVKGKSR